MLNRLLWKVARFVKKHTKNGSRLITNLDGDPYLLRVYLTPRWFKYRPMLHYFFRSDGDRALHNHPWKKSFSLILTHGYDEERLDHPPDECDAPLVVKRTLRPGNINVIKANDFHRATLREPVEFDLDSGCFVGGCWTFFLAGEREQDWGFWDGEKYTPHQEYFDGSH